MSNPGRSILRRGALTMHESAAPYRALTRLTAPYHALPRLTAYRKEQQKTQQMPLSENNKI